MSHTKIENTKGREARWKTEEIGDKKKKKREGEEGGKWKRKGEHGMRKGKRGNGEKNASLLLYEYRYSRNSLSFSLTLFSALALRKQQNKTKRNEMKRSEGKRGKQDARRSWMRVSATIPEERIVERTTCSMEENEISDSVSHSKLPL